MSLSQSLAKLLEKMGGGAPDAPAGGEEAILAEIAETYDPDSGIELPKVTTDDNGKVLAVVSGEWVTSNILAESINQIPVPYYDNVAITGDITSDLTKAGSLTFENLTYLAMFGHWTKGFAFNTGSSGIAIIPAKVSITDEITAEFIVYDGATPVLFKDTGSSNTEKIVAEKVLTTTQNEET